MSTRIGQTELLCHGYCREHEKETDGMIHDIIMQRITEYLTHSKIIGVGRSINKLDKNHDEFVVLPDEHMVEWKELPNLSELVDHGNIYRSSPSRTATKCMFREKTAIID